MSVEGAVLSHALSRPGSGPAPASPGKATIRVEFPEGSKFQSIATDIEVELVNSRDNK